MSHLLYSDQVRFGMQPFDDDEEPESLYPPDSFPVPDECDECKAWCYDRSDHENDCKYFEENPLPF